LTAPQDTMMPDTSPPPRIPGYRYLSDLGSGGYATVHLYEDEQLGRKVAVKVLRALDAAARRQFAGEMRAMAAFDNDPHIVSMIHPGRTEDDRPYFIMQYCSNGTLADRIGPDGLAVAEVVEIGVRIAEALDAVHAKQLVHRDVKPANILIDERNQPRLSDFGIVGSLLPQAGTESEDFGISVAWSPPEMLRGAYGSKASDVYSLGATLWHLLTGRSPYEIPNGDNTAAALERRICAARLSAPRRSNIPVALTALLTRMLDQDPAKRPGSAGDVAVRLAALRTDPGPTSPGLSGTPVAGQTIRRSKLPVAGPNDWPVGRKAAPDFGNEPESGSAHPPILAAAVDPSMSSEALPQDSGTSRGRGLFVVGTVVAVAVVALIAVNALHHSPSQPAAASSTTASSGAGQDDAAADQNAGVLGEEEPPGPPTVTAQRTGPTTLRFTWTYSSPLGNDTFRWRTSDGARTGTSTTPSVALTDPAGTQLCVQVDVVRADGSNATVAWSASGCGS
jgi:eukaryotic-like serine/threonine-protein kinase